MSNKKTASELAAERLGYGEPDPRADVLGDVETLLSLEKWSDRDRAAARANLARMRELPPFEPEAEEEKPERRPATASEIAGAHMLGGKQAAQDTARDGIVSGGDK